MPKLTTRKSKLTPGRYEVLLDGESAGWVSRSSIDGTWSFHAPVYRVLSGHCLVRGMATRKDAIEDGLSSLKIYHGSRIVRTNWETLEEESVFLPIEVWQEERYQRIKAELEARLA